MLGQSLVTLGEDPGVGTRLGHLSLCCKVQSGRCKGLLLCRNTSVHVDGRQVPPPLPFSLSLFF